MSKKINEAATDLHARLTQLEHSGQVELSSDDLAHIVGGAYMAQKMLLSSQRVNPGFKLTDESGGCTCNVTTCCKACTP
jgi:hypothetical protein